jgi:hypothetical protein
MIATMPRAWSKLCITRILSGSSYQHDLYQNRSSHLSPNALKRGFHTSCLQICPTLTIRCYEPKLQSQRHRRFHVASLDLDNLDPLLIWDTRKLRSKRPGRRKAGSTHVGSIRCCLTTTLEEGRGVHRSPLGRHDRPHPSLFALGSDRIKLVGENNGTIVIFSIGGVFKCTSPSPHIWQVTSGPLLIGAGLGSHGASHGYMLIPMDQLEAHQGG